MGRGRLSCDARQPGEGMNRFKSRARSLRANETAAEDILWQALRSRQLTRWKFRRQHPITRYIVDFVALDGKLIVEVDGGTHGTDAERVRDDERRRELERLGFHVLRVTNTDVCENLEGVLATILHELGAL
jgi:very-short-patch-repair endonuclease